MALNTRPSKSDEVSTNFFHCDERLQLGRGRAGLFPARTMQVVRVQELKLRTLLQEGLT